MGRLRGQDHGAAHPHAQHPVRPQQQIRRRGDGCGINHGQGLRNGVHVRCTDLPAHLPHIVLRQYLPVQRVDRPLPRAGPRNRQLESAVSPVTQAAAEPGHGGFRHLRDLRQLGDGHVLALLPLGEDVVRDFFLCAGELVIFPVDFCEYISVRHSSSFPPASAGCFRGAGRLAGYF